MRIYKVVIAEDEEVVREGIKFLIQQDKEIKVIGTASNGIEAFSLCKKMHPDIVLMDLGMPECDGVEGTELIKSEFPDIKILVLSSFSDNKEVCKALKNGADGYVHKDIKPEELINMIKSVVSGIKIVHPNVFFKTMGDLNGSKEVIPDRKMRGKDDGSVNLTEREKNVIQLIVKGKSNKEISDALFISEGRVKNIITKVLEKLELKDRTQLAVYAVKNKLIK